MIEYRYNIQFIPLNCDIGSPVVIGFWGHFTYIITKTILGRSTERFTFPSSILIFIGSTLDTITTFSPISKMHQTLIVVKRTKFYIDHSTSKISMQVKQIAANPKWTEIIQIAWIHHFKELGISWLNKDALWKTSKCGY